MTIPIQKSNSQINSSEIDFRKISEETELVDLIEYMNDFITYFNYFNKAISLDRNFKGAIQEISFAATGDAGGNDYQRIYHGLGFVPKYRIILRQTGNGILEDVPSAWNEKFVTIRNRGSEASKASIMLLRG